MLSLKSRTVALALALSLCSVSACGTPAGLSLPPAADLAVEAKPVPSDDTVTSDQAAQAYNIEVEAWGERGWRAVARLCRWSKGMGLAVDCPAPPPDS
jgi:hypothetical protein